MCAGFVPGSGPSDPVAEKVKRATNELLEVHPVQQRIVKLSSLLEQADHDLLLETLYKAMFRKARPHQNSLRWVFAEHRVPAGMRLLISASSGKALLSTPTTPMPRCLWPRIVSQQAVAATHLNRLAQPFFRET